MIELAGGGLLITVLVILAIIVCGLIIVGRR